MSICNLSLSLNKSIFYNPQSISGADLERARFYLESSGWQLDLAISSFFENDGDLGQAPEAKEQPMEEGDKDKDKGRPDKKDRGKTGSGFQTLASMMSDSDSDSDGDGDKGQAFYAGGSEHSGQQVYNIMFCTK